MPRTKLGDKYSVKAAPPLDEAWGAVLVRMKQTDKDMKQLAEETGYHYDTIRAALGVPPVEWSPQMRDKILQALGLRCRLVVEDAGR